MNDEEICELICDSLFNCDIVTANSLLSSIKNELVKKEFEALFDYCVNCYRISGDLN